MRVGVVGAGISGLLCAQRLLLQAEKPLQITVFEWGRGPGGRTARKRVTLENGEEISFDHAAPYFSAKSTAFKALLKEWEVDGCAAPWIDAREDLWVGTPSNHAICRHLAEVLASAGASLLYGRHVRTARHDATTDEWVLQASNRANSNEEEHRFDMLVLSDKLLLLNNPYAILPPADWGPLSLQQDGMEPSSTGAVVLMLALERTPDRHDLPLLRPTQSLLKLVVHESSKPGRQERGTSPHLDVWVAHSTPAYAAAHLIGDDPPDLRDPSAVLAEMQAATLSELAAATARCYGAAGDVAGEESSGQVGAAAPTTSDRPKVAYASVFAWDHAQTSVGSSMSPTHLLDERRRAGVCGDFFAGPEGYEGVEAAAMSGQALAEALLPFLRISR